MGEYLPERRASGAIDVGGKQPPPIPPYKRPLVWITSGLLAVSLSFLVDRAMELSDVKPNIIAACAVWLLVYGCLVGLFWMWASK